MGSDETDAFVSPLDYPMFIVTVAEPGNDHGAPVRPSADPVPASGRAMSGCLVGFATQCSIEPFRLLVCISKANHTYTLARTAAVLGLHVLDSGQRDLARLFGETTGDEVDKFGLCSWRRGPEGLPILDGCAAWMVAAVRQRIDLGDHVGFLLEPVEVHSRPGAAALPFSKVSDLQAGHGA